MDQKQKITQIIGILSANYRKKLSDAEISLITLAARRWGLGAVESAIHDHVFDRERGRFYPTLADIAEKIESKSLVTEFKPTPDAIIAAARDPKTPLGVLARIKIGSWDLNNQDSYYLRTAAHGVIQEIPAWQTRAQSGNYSAHEIEIMEKFSVSPAQPFAIGLPPPATASTEDSDKTQCPALGGD